MDPKNVSLIVPVYNEEEALPEFAGNILDLSKTYGFELIFVLDGCTDKSRDILEQLQINYLSHSLRYGYGAALKTGVRMSKRDYCIFIDGDGQHRLDDVLRITREADGTGMVIGERRNLYRLSIFAILGRFILTGLVNLLSGSKIKDINSGLRLVPKKFFYRYESVLPDNFSCTTTLTIISLKLKQPLKFIPIEVLKRKGKSKVNLFSDGLNLMMLILRTIILLDPLVIFLPLSFIFILISIFYGAVVALKHGLGIPVGALVLFITGIIIFALGVICDQVSSLRLSLLKK